MIKSPTLLQIQDYRFVRRENGTDVQLCNGSRYAVCEELADLDGTEVVSMYKGVEGTYFVQVDTGPRKGRRWDAPNDTVFCNIEFVDGVGPALRCISLSNSIHLIPLT